jgi:hypothetical protein
MFSLLEPGTSLAFGGSHRTVPAAVLRACIEDATMASRTGTRTGDGFPNCITALTGQRREVAAISSEIHEAVLDQH